LYRMSYEAANFNIRGPTNQVQYLIQKDTAENTITPQQKAWSEKAVQKYTAAQDKKWQRWNEAMFERS
jgi:hypothetical protein